MVDAVASFESIFTNLDLDGDGQVTLQEVHTIFNASKAQGEYKAC